MPSISAARASHSCRSHKKSFLELQKLSSRCVLTSQDLLRPAALPIGPDDAVSVFSMASCCGEKEGGFHIASCRTGSRS
jgi:hypothetical protein